MNRSTRFDFFLNYLACQSAQKSSSGFFVFENTGNIGTVRGKRRKRILSVDMQHPVDNRQTDSPARHLAEPIADGQTMMTKRWSPSPCPREGGVALILA